MIQRHPLLIEGIEAAKAGDKAKARLLLTQVVRRNPDSVETWLWLSSIFDTPQGRAFCLEQVLRIDPTNRAAQRGLAALGAGQAAQPPPAPRLSSATIVPSKAIAPQTAIASPLRGQGLTTTPMPVARPAPTGRHDRLWSRPRFWQAVVICLGVIALALAGVLAYDAIKPPAGDQLLAAVLPAPAASPHPQHTLRPTFTFTPQPTDTATPAPTPTFTQTPTPCPTPTAMTTPEAERSGTPTPTPQPTRRSAGLVPAATSTPRPTLAPPVWDPRLTALGVRLEPAAVPPGVGYWRLVEARWADGQESGGKHTIYVEVLNPRGSRVVGQPVIFEWSSGSLTLPVENRPAPDWGVNFPMFATLGSYSARVGVESSDRVVGMGMGTIENPDFTVHTCFYLTFRWTQR
jgi:hypothetical protein